MGAGRGRERKMSAGMGVGLLLGACVRLIGRVIPRRLRLKMLSVGCVTMARGGDA